MGGNGMLSSSGKLQYGEEFESIDKFTTPLGEVKVLKSSIFKNNKPVYVTKAENRIYAMVDKKTGRLRELYFFNSMGAVREVWNIGWSSSSHRHKDDPNVNSSLHTHIGTGLGHEKGPARRLTKAERRFARTVDRRWRNRKAYRSGIWKT